MVSHKRSQACGSKEFYLFVDAKQNIVFKSMIQRKYCSKFCYTNLYTWYRFLRDIRCFKNLKCNFFMFWNVSSSMEMWLILMVCKRLEFLRLESGGQTHSYFYVRSVSWYLNKKCIVVQVYLRRRSWSSIWFLINDFILLIKWNCKCMN